MMKEQTTINSNTKQPPVESSKKDRASYLSAAFMVFAALLFLVLGVVWLGLVLVVVLLSFMAYKWGKRRFGAFRWFKSLQYSVVFAAVFFLAIFIRLFVFEVYEIPSESMENTLLPGDKIVVNKLVIGPQTPKSPFDIPWVNLLFYINKQARAHIDSTWWEPVRLSGWSNIRHNDILVFKNEPLAPDYFIKRCVALPGNDFHIVDGKIFIDGKSASTNELPGIKSNYIVYVNRPDSFGKLIDSLQIARHFYHQWPQGNQWELSLGNRDASAIKLSAYVDSMHIKVHPPDADAWLSPYGKRAVWSIDNYGPVKVPHKGWNIPINDEMINLYFETIRNWESKAIETIDGKYYVDGEESLTFTFENNYYVFMGDHRHNSIDSRMWGFLPEQSIVGKATNVLWSNDQNGIKWKRILKRIK